MNLLKKPVPSFKRLGEMKLTEATRLLIGWREYLALPRLGLPVLKAKVDTGARTSSLHAFKIETFHEYGTLKVRFRVHPVQRRNDIVVVCEAPIVDRRMVSDSGGHREMRYVIKTPMEVDGHIWPIEITLANRETMSFRMLLGRSAMTHLLIDPSQSYLLGRPEKIAGAYEASKTTKKKKVRSKTIRKSRAGSDEK